MAEKSIPRASDKLWLHLMASVQHNASNSVLAKKWKTVQDTDTDCQLCDDPGGGALIVCSQENCNKAFHLECAYNQGGLSLFNGVLTFQCDAHFKPILFCSCKEPYDENKAMIYCDDCCDWFHDKCAGVTAKQAIEAESYTCKSCSALKSKKKAIPAELKKSNQQKEARYVCSQKAFKTMHVLTEIADFVCGLVDTITIPTKKTKFSIAEIKEVVEYLNALMPAETVSVSARKSKSNSEEEVDNDDRLLDDFQLFELLVEWRNLLQDYVTNYDKWTESCTAWYNQLDILSENQIDLDYSMVDKYKKIVSAVEQRSKDLLDSIHHYSTPVDLIGFNAFADGVKWIFEVLQKLHTEEKNEQWYLKTLTALRSGNVKMKNLTAVANNHFASKLLPGLASFYQHTSQVVGEMNQWYTKTYNIMNEDSLYKLSDLVSYLQVADGFPTTPVLYSDLKEIIEEANQLEDKIQQVLARSTIDDNYIEELNVKKEDLAVELPSEDRFSLVCEKLVFLKAFELATTTNITNEVGESQDQMEVDDESDTAAKSGRITKALVESLKAEAAEKVEQNDADLQSELSGAIDIKIQAAIEYIDNLLSTASQVVGGISEEVLSGSGDVKGAIGKLRALTIVTPEEELLSFLQESSLLSAQSDEILNAKSQVSIDQLNSICKDIDALLGNTVIDEFQIVIDCKKAMKTSRNLLVDKLTTAEKYWSMLELEIARCKSEEEVVTLEDLQLAFENAVNSNVENIDVSEPAEYFLAAGRKHTEEVELAMKQLIDVSDAVIERAKELWKIAKTCPLPKELCTRLKRRIDVCTTVNKCSKFLDQSSLPNFHSDERYLASVRELKTTLSNLLHDESTEIEATMLEKVSGPFNLYHWRCEVNGLWIHGSQLATAEKLLEEACKLGDAAISTDEWKVLEKEIKAARENTETALLLVENFNKATATLEDEISIDASNVVQIIEHYLKTWNDSTTELKERLASCLAAEQSIRIKQPDIHHQLVECHEAIRLVESSSSVVLRILGIMAEFGADSSLVQSENALQLSSRHVIDFRDLTTLANNLAEYAVKLPQFKLMGVLHHSINKLHADSYKWNEEAQVLIPPKATRNKSKIETKTTTRTAIVEKLMEPVALAVRLPMHERLLSTLSEIDTFSTELLAFLLSGVAIKASISIQDQFDEKFQNQLYEDIGKLYHMQETINLLPVDLSEAQVLNWLIQLFEWTQYVPYPSDDPAHAGIVLSDAKSKLQSAATVIAQVPSNVLQLLSSLKVLNLDPTVGPQGFVERTHNVIKLSGSLLDFLEKEVDKAEKIQREIEVALEMRAGHNQLLHLSLRMASLLVQPDFAVKKNLDRELKASEIAEANKASGKAPKKPESEGKSSGQRDYSQPLTLSGHKLEVKPRAELTVVPPVNTVKCAAASCDGQVLIGRGAYCSDQCACASASSLFSDLLTARNLITSIAYVEKHYSGSNLNEEILRIAQLLVADKKAFQILRENDESIEEIFSKKLDQKNYIASLNSALTTNKPKDENPTTPSSEKKLPMLMDLLGGLPVAAASVVLRSEAGEMTAVPSTPTLAAAPSDDDVRFKVRLAFEDFFMKMFFKLLGRDYVGVSAILALEMEEELSKKYTTVLMQGRDSRDGAKSRKELNRKEYRQRFMSLIQNLKRSHNEQLLVKLARFDLSVTEILNMTGQQLADASTQLLREKLHDAAFIDSQLRSVSTQETLEQKRREAGSEGWGSKGEGRAISSAKTIIPLKKEVKLKVKEHREGVSDELEELEREEDHMEIDEVEEEPKPEPVAVGTSNSTTNRSLQIEQNVQQLISKNSGVTRAPKRPLDIDAGMRFTSSKARKSDADVAEDKGRRSPVESPRNNAPNLLAALKASGNSSPKDSSSPRASSFSSSSNHKATAAGSSVPTTLATGIHQGSVGDPLKLLNRDGSYEISVYRPSNVVIPCTGVIADRRAQGLLPSTVTIAGRTRIAMLETFVNENMATGKRIVVPFTLFVENKDNGKSGYGKFCAEFVKDERAGLDNLLENVQVYILPPALKNRITILRGYQEEQGNVLYGLAVFKEVGSKMNSETANVKADLSALRAMVSQNSVAPESAKGIPVAKPAALLPPPTPPKIPLQANPIPSSGHTAVQAIASGNSIAKPLFPQAVPPPIPAPKPISMAAPPPKPPLPAGIPQEQRDMIEKVAQFCASKGVETLKALRDKEESKKLMPFLYDGAPGHTDFLAALKRHVGIAGPSAPEKQQPMPPNNSSNERRSRFGPK